MKWQMVSALTCSINLFLLHLQPRLNSNIPRNLSPGWAPQLSGLSSNPFQLSHFYLNYSPTMYSYLKKRQRPCCPHNLCTKWGVPKWGISWPISQHYKFLYIWIYYLFTYTKLCVHACFSSILNGSLPGFHRSVRRWI